MTTLSINAVIAPVLPADKLVRAEKNRKFANDGSLASVDVMLHKIAIKCYSRVSAMGLPMEFDDVLQEMRVSYVKAKAKWSPDGGALFSTYCTTVCQNNFNHAIKKMERDRKELGLGSVHEMTKNMDGDDLDPMGVLMSAAAPISDSPDARLLGMQNMQTNLAKLSAGSKRLVAMLLQCETKSIHPSPRLRDIARQVGLEGPELKRAKLEILNTFGVTWQ